MHLTKRERRIMKAAPSLSTTERVSIARHWPKARGRMPSQVFVPAALPDDPYGHIDQTGKGQFKGKCNVTACEERGEDIAWWNRPMRAFYCSDCRREISRFDDYRGTPQQIFENAPRVDADTPAAHPENESVATTHGEAPCRSTK
jgi:hypothetical protein